MQPGDTAPPALPIPIGIVGLGKIARDQHLPRIAENPAFVLAATASPHGIAPGVRHFSRLEDMLAAALDIRAVAICTPPQLHHRAASLALAHGLHVLLEKPPCPSLAELADLERRASAAGRTLFTPWHSQYAHSVARAVQILRGSRLRDVRITWQENVKQWHPGQRWLTEPGGFGVFDAGINPISILTRLVPDALLPRSARLAVPSNWSTPIKAQVEWESAGGATIAATLDFAYPGTPCWEIELLSEAGPFKLSDGGATLTLGDEPAPAPRASLDEEYAAIYRRFAELIERGESEVDARPLECVADVFLVGHRVSVEPFTT